MTELNERTAALETNMKTVLEVLAKREEYQANVLKSLTTIEFQTNQSLLYQKTCDAERTAHAARLGTVENKVEALMTTPGQLASVSARVTVVETRIAKGTTVWWTLLRIAAAAGGLVTVGAAAAELWHWLHP